MPQFLRDLASHLIADSICVAMATCSGGPSTSNTIRILFDMCVRGLCVRKGRRRCAGWGKCCSCWTAAPSGRYL